MNAKNIKKSLSATLKRWTDNVPDEKVRKIIKDNAVITGGAIVSLLTGEPVNDYDVYFRTKEACLSVAEYYVGLFKTAHPNTNVEVGCTGEGRITIHVKSRGVAGEEAETGITDESEPGAVASTQFEESTDKPKYQPIFLSSNAITLSSKIQIVVRFYGEPDKIHENYDFVHCTCAWSSWDNVLSLPPKALEAIINKELVYSGSKYPLCSIIRTRKFISRGWSINAGQYLKMAMQLNELDLKNIDVLEEQLTGVDSAYFMTAITALREKQAENAAFTFDNCYLAEIINRIF